MNKYVIRRKNSFLWYKKYDYYTGFYAWSEDLQSAKIYITLEKAQEVQKKSKLKGSEIVKVIISEVE